jgi:hypothetical protein
MSDMEWDELDPIVKTVPWCKAWVTVNNDGLPRLNLSLSEATLNDVGRADKANVQVVVKDGKALVRIVFGPTGKFTVKALELGGARIHNIPPKDPIPDGARDLEPCEVEKKEKGELILILPLDAWQAQLNRPVVLKPAPPPPPPPPPKQGPIEAVVYLRAKGVKCSKLAGDWWMLEGNRVPRMEVLARVNEHRRNADLKPLSIDQIE